MIDMPDSHVMFINNLLVFDHVRNTIKVVAHVRLDGDVEANYREAGHAIDLLIDKLSQPLGNLPYQSDSSIVGQPVTQNWSQQSYKEAVQKIKRYIVDGDVIQAVLSLRLSRETGVHPFEVYRSLRGINP